MKFDGQKTISSLGKVITGKTPSTKTKEYWNGNIPFITPKDLQGNKHIINTERSVTSKGASSVKGAILPVNAVCVSCIGVIGYVGMTTEDSVSNQQINTIIVNEDNDADYVYYLMKWLWPYFKNYEGQSTTLSILNKTHFSQIDIPYHQINVQKKIARFLSDIDDKIEINTAINKNLESQAQAIFESWFVDFEPFGGEMPHDWKYGNLQDIADFFNGYAFKSKELLNEPMPNCYQVFKQGHINRGGGFNSSGTKSWYPIEKSVKLHRYILRRGDVLMAMTDMKDNVAILGNTALMPIDNRFIVNQRVGLLRSNGYKGTSYAYIYLLTNNFDFVTNLRKRANSGVQVNLSSSAIKESPILIANESVNKKFNNLVEPMLLMIMSNDLENQYLSNLRDTLLPRLMSGEIDVSKIDV